MSGNPNYNALQRAVCGCGWCGSIVNGEPSHVDDFIPDCGPVTADQFVDWLLIAEGLDPVTDLTTWYAHKDDLRKLFIRHMGADVVEASDLKWYLG